MLYNESDLMQNMSQKWKHVGFNKNALLCKASVLIVSSIILQLLGFIFRIEISRHAGTQGLAIYQLIMSGYNIIMAFSLQGVTLAASRYSSQRMALHDYDGLRYTKRLSIQMFLLLFFIIAIPCLIFRGFVAETILGDKRTELGLFFILICIFLTGFENINKSIFLGTQRVVPTTISEISELCIRIAGVVALLQITKGQSDEISAAVIVIAMILSELSSVCYLSLKYKKTFRRKDRMPDISRHPVPLSEKKQLRSSYLKTAVPVSMSGLVNKIILSANTILLPQMLMLGGMARQQAMSDFAVMFSMTIPLTVLPTCIILPVCNVVMPKISEDTIIYDQMDIRRKSAKILQIVGVAAIPLMFLLFFFAEPACNLLYHSPQGAKYAGILAFAAVFEYYQIAGASILNGLGYSGRAAASVVAEGLIQLLFTCVFVPIMKMDGFVIGNILSTIVGALMNLVAVKKHAAIKFRWKNWVFNPVISSLIAAFSSRLVFLFTIARFGQESAALLCALGVFVILYLAIMKLLGNSVIKYLKETLLSPGQTIPEKKPASR